MSSARMAFGFRPRAALLGATLACLAACGRPNHNVQVEPALGTKGLTDSTSGSSTGKGACLKTSCPAAVPDLGASFFQATGALMGIRGESVNWEFDGLDTATATADNKAGTRRIGVILDKLPTGAKSSPAADSKTVETKAHIVWTPSSEDHGTLDVILRDLDRCDHDGKSDCQGYTFLDAYDTRIKDVRWEVVDRANLQKQLDLAKAGTGTDGTASTATTFQTDGTVVTISDPTCGGIVPTSQSQIIGTLGQTAIQALLSPASLIGVGITSIGTMILSGNQKPHQC